MSVSPVTSAEVAVANVRATLAYRGLKFKDLSGLTGIPSARLSSRNTGETVYDLADLDKIAAALDVEPHELITPRT